MKKTATNELSIPDASRSAFDDITGRTDQFCREHLTEEFVVVCRKLATKLARKRPSPLLRGRPEIWAAAVAYSVGKVNFIFDKTQKPHIAAPDLSAAFGATASSVTQKARVIQDLLDISVMDPNCTVPSRLDDNPMVWMLTVNGLIMDIRYAPRGAQEEAYRRGLIPYVPADRSGSSPTGPTRGPRSRS